MAGFADAWGPARWMEGKEGRKEGWMDAWVGGWMDGWLDVCLSACLLVCPYVGLLVSLSVCLLVCLSVCRSACLSVCLRVCFCCCFCFRACLFVCCLFWCRCCCLLVVSLGWFRFCYVEVVNFLGQNSRLATGTLGFRGNAITEFEPTLRQSSSGTLTRFPSSALSHPFFGREGSPAKIEYRKSWYPCSNLSTGGPRLNMIVL